MIVPTLISQVTCVLSIQQTIYVSGRVLSGWGGGSFLFPNEKSERKREFERGKEREGEKERI